MRSKNPNENEQFENVLHVQNQMDVQSTIFLELFKVSQTSRNEQQQIELKRLTVKYGPNHSRVQKLETELNHYRDVATAIDLRLDILKTQDEPLPADAWRLQGYVNGNNAEPMPGLTVAIGIKRDEKTGVTRAKAEDHPLFDTTNDTGWYSITISGEYLKMFSQYEFYLMVLDSKKQVIYTSKNKLTPTPGVIDFLDVVITVKANTKRADKGPKTKKK